jgi:hypothetical protein
MALVETIDLDVTSALASIEALEVRLEFVERRVERIVTKLREAQALAAKLEG